MSTPTSVQDVLELYESRGEDHYGEDVTQLSHALQCAALARRNAAADELVAAALLHDIGHLLEDDNSFLRIGVDDRHEATGARVVAALFGPSVAAPIALHVTAKRWRCATDPDYVASLSPASIASLQLQGGPLGPEEQARFEHHPAFANAIGLRGWDDAAKDPLLELGAIRDFEPLLDALFAIATQRGPS